MIEAIISLAILIAVSYWSISAVLKWRRNFMAKMAAKAAGKKEQQAKAKAAAAKKATTAAKSNATTKTNATTKPNATTKTTAAASTKPAAKKTTAPSQSQSAKPQTATAGGNGNALSPSQNRQVQEQADRLWIRQHPHTKEICDYYYRLWAPGREWHQHLVANDEQIDYLELEMKQDKIVEYLYYQDGRYSTSELTYSTLMGDETSDSKIYYRLQSLAKRDELKKLIYQTLDSFSYITSRNGRLYVDRNICQATTGVDVPQIPGYERSQNAPQAATGTKASAASDPEDLEAADYQNFVNLVLQHYRKNWDRNTGAVYLGLEKTPIAQFAIDVKTDKIIESFWLILENGSQFRTNLDTAYTMITTENCIPDMSSKTRQDNLLLRIAMYLLELGTVEVRGDYFYPIVKGGTAAPQAAAPQASALPSPAPQPAAAANETPTKPEGEVSKAFAAADQDAKLKAQIQAMLEQQKRSQDQDQK
jgi:hypothetical protein